MASVTFTVGRLLCSKVRRYLERQAFQTNIKYMETSGLFQRDFIIDGTDEEVLVVLNDINNWTDENNIRG